MQQFVCLGDRVRMMIEVLSQGNLMLKMPVTHVKAGWTADSDVMLSWQPHNV
ncbi:TOBE domain-containing protein [Rouxiella badensis]|uniref:TOBE domain-containing protein n=1 Tax=Rouxiella badensis TaxID=1646377 RepID=UPI0022AAE11C|nr:TOBE domain-containing protein [Rouxiella badensis]WAT11242.1 TOBE domain-containing protein [Rouxiella badensis]